MKNDRTALQASETAATLTQELKDRSEQLRLATHRLENNSLRLLSLLSALGDAERDKRGATLH